MMIDNVLILGSGYIGKNLTSKLISLGDIKSVENVRQAFLNYKDEDKLREYLIKGKPNYLINASGYTGSPNVEGCENNWQDCYWMNVVVPVRIAKVCKELDIPFINIGSGCIYDNQDKIYSLATGSAQKGINKENFLNLKVNIPKDKKLIEDLEPIFNNIEIYQNKIKENDILYQQYIQELLNESIN